MSRVLRPMVGRIGRRLRGSGGADRGSVSVELVIVVPGLVMILGLALAGGRIWFAKGVVDDAAYSAARSASLARTAPQADRDGRTDGAAALDTGGLECRQQSVTIDTTGFGVAVGTPSAVTARVSCTVELADLVVPGLPGSLRLDAETSVPLDTYRAR